MRTADLLGFCAAALLRQRRRSGLSLLGVAIGVAAVVVLTAVGEGARRYVIGQFRALGSNLLVVLPGHSETTGVFPGGSPAPNDLTLQDALAIVRGVPGARRVAPIHVGNETISFGERRRQTPVLGATHELMASRDLLLRSGRFLPEAAFEDASPIVVLGSFVARELFGDERAVGAVVRVGGWRMRVVGVLDRKGTQMALDVDKLVVVPVATSMRMFNASSLSEIVVKVDAQQDLEPVRRRVAGLLRERHGEEDFTCITEESVISSLSRILRALTAAVGGIAAISLFVAGVVVMNLMLVSVSERTAEVGLLKALGASRRQILWIFLTETLLLVAAGTLLGLALGLAGVQLVVRLQPALPAAPPLWAVAAVVVTALAAGTVFGALPARRATRLDPVEALARG